LSELVAELVGLKVDVLLAGGSPAALAAKNATQTIPIVMVGINPVGLGLAASLSRPGNVTGLTYLSEETIAKRLQLLTELLPGLARVGVLGNHVLPAPQFSSRIAIACQDIGAGENGSSTRSSHSNVLTRPRPQADDAEHHSYREPREIQSRYRGRAGVVIA